MLADYKTLRTLGLYVAKRTLCHLLAALAYLMSQLFAQPKRSQIPPIDDHNLVTPAIKLAQQIKAGHISSEEVCESFIARIKLVNPLINAVVDRRFEQALKEARQIDRRLADARDDPEADQSVMRLPLAGVPVSIKETIAVDGYSFTAGLVGRRFVKAPRHADSVRELMRAGLIPIAVTNVPELSMWWDSSNPVYGATNNPYDLSRIPGGSTGGEGALIAAAGSVVGIGSDIGGSLRIPANFCCLFSHKPSPFLVSTEGIYPTVKGEREKLLGVGPMTRYACDLMPMLRVLAGPRIDRLKHQQQCVEADGGGAHTTTTTTTTTATTTTNGVNLAKLKIFYLEELGDPMVARCNADILEGMHACIGKLAAKFKCPVEKVFFEEFRHGFFLWSAEANAEPGTPSIARQLKNGGNSNGANGNGGGGDEMNPLMEFGKKIVHTSEHNMTSILAASLDTLSPQQGTRENLSLLEQAAELRQKFNQLLGDEGVLFCPTHPEPAPAHHTTFLKVFNVAYTSVVNTLQAPVTQVPLGLSKEGLPYGVQIVGAPLNDQLTIAVAQEIEKLNGGWQPPCRIDL